MNFSEYSKSKKKGGDKLSPDIKQKLSSFLSQYDGKSEDEIFESILAVAEQNKKDGKLDNAEVDNFVRMISPMLNDSQREKLGGVVEKIKNQK